ncbi:protein Wnt-5a-like [Rhopilema esculentum]|uniref:protein Wnt-5a-like n=1 Tax=Rhopilema esculentum TaxID=499914 RepID=UPI0031DB15E8
MGNFVFNAVFLLVLLSGVHSFIIKPLSICSARRGLSQRQVKLCNEYRNHMQFIVDGTKMALDECQRQFKDRRWNCTFPLNHMRGFIPFIPKGHREASFVHAIVSAGTFHAVSRACMEAKLTSHCHCSQEARPDSLRKSFLWAGCGDNLPYGYSFSKLFMDAREQLGSDATQDIQKISRVLMNLHNNEAGRRALMENSFVQCRCHGLSKGCATKTCYRQLKPFKAVGEFLKDQYASGIESEISQKRAPVHDGEMELKLREKYPQYQKISKRNLVYLEESPNYCLKDMSLGSLGTKGRQCNRTSEGLNSCSLLCCGRGFHVKRQLTRESCACQFIWCCHLKCQTCEVEKNMHYCK